MREEKYTKLILSDLAGELSQEDRLLLESWVAEAPKHQEIYAEIKKIWTLSEETETPLQLNVDQEFARFKARIKPAVTAAPTAKIRPLWQRSWAKAAAVLVLLTAGLWVFNQSNTSTNEQWVTVVTQDEKRTIELPDNSTIWLNKHSKISYLAGFEERIVELKGEAYFDVAKKNGQNFVIQTGSTKTEVLGTTFNIRAYQQEPIVEVVVFTGKVSFEAIEDQKTEVILLPDDKGIFHKTDQKLEKAESTNPNVLAWKSGQLQFSEQSLEQIIPIIEQYYNIDIQTSNNSILKCTFTGDFDKANAKDLLESIAFGLNLELNIAKNSYQLNGKGCQ